MNIETLTTFLAWCTVINFGLLIFATVMMIAFKDFVRSIHQKMFGLDDEDLIREYFRYLANYKILIIVFNFVPYLVLRLFF